jgi:hypothetical protein
MQLVEKYEIGYHWWKCYWWKYEIGYYWRKYSGNMKWILLEVMVET